MSQPIVRMENVDKYYGDFHVLKNINFSVSEGEIVVICGPSGSGKSTLIRCINRLEEIDSGEITTATWATNHNNFTFTDGEIDIF